jgi:hypothetical protein
MSKALNLTQPPEWLIAFRKQAKRDRLNLSKWVGECCVANLDDDLRKKLPERRSRGRPTRKPTPPPPPPKK